MRSSFATTIAVFAFIGLVYADPVRFTLYAAPGVSKEVYPLPPISAQDDMFGFEIGPACHTVIQAEDSVGGQLSVVGMAPGPAGPFICNWNNSEPRYDEAERYELLESPLPIFIGKNSELRIAKSSSDELPEGAVLGRFKYVESTYPGGLGFLKYTGSGGFYMCYMGEHFEPREGSLTSLPRDWFSASQLFVDDGRNEFWAGRKCHLATIRVRNIVDGTLDLHSGYRLKQPEKISIEDPDERILDDEDKDEELEDKDMYMDIGNEEEYDDEEGLGYLVSIPGDEDEYEEDEDEEGLSFMVSGL